MSPWTTTRLMPEPRDLQDTERLTGRGAGAELVEIRGEMVLARAVPDALDRTGQQREQEEETEERAESDHDAALPVPALRDRFRSRLLLRLELRRAPGLRRRAARRRASRRLLSQQPAHRLAEQQVGAGPQEQRGEPVHSAAHVRERQRQLRRG